MSRAYEVSLQRLIDRAAKLRREEESRIPWCGWVRSEETWNKACSLPSEGECEAYLSRNGFSGEFECVVLREGKLPEGLVEVKQVVKDDGEIVDVLTFPGVAEGNL